MSTAVRRMVAEARRYDAVLIDTGDYTNCWFIVRIGIGVSSPRKRCSPSGCQRLRRARKRTGCEQRVAKIFRQVLTRTTSLPRPHQRELQSLGTPTLP